MGERKTSLPSLRNQSWEKIKVKIEKLNKVLQHISMDSITEQNKLIHAGAKLVGHKIGIPLKNPSRKL